MAVAEKVTVELELKDQQYNARVKSSEREFQRSMDATERAAADAARGIDRTLGQVPDSLRRQYRELGTDIGRSLGGISRAAQLASGAIVAYSLNAARKAEDINDAFKFTFNEIGENADAAAERIASAFNRTSSSVKANLTNAYQVLSGLGLSSADSFTAAQQIAERSIDLASQKGISDARAYEAIISGLTGETEPLKRLGVVLSEATVQAELLRLGFKGNASDASEAQKAVARYNLILAKTATAQGDVARTSESANNKLKEAQTEFENAAIALGNELLPALVSVAGAATDVLKAFNDLPGGVQIAGLAFLGLIAAGGPIAGLIANLGRLRTIAIAATAAIAGIGGGGAAGAAGAAGLARFGLAGVAAAGVVSLSGDTQGPDINRSIASAQSQLSRARTTAERADAQRQLDYFYARRSQMNATMEADALAGVTRAAPAADASVIGGFGLGGVGNTAPGSRSGGGRGGRSGAAGLSESARDLDRLRADLARVQEGQLTAAEKAAADLAETIAIINRAVDAKYITPREAAILSGGVAGENLTNAPRAPLTSALDVTGRDIARDLREGDQAEQERYREQGADIANSFIDILRSGNIGEEIGLRFADAAFNSLQQALTGIFAGLLQNGGQAGGIVAGIGSFFGFGGGRAMGGPVRKGFSYDVGESGREKFVAPADGYIMPNMGAQARSSGAQRIDIRQTFSLEGATGDQAIYGNVQRMIVQGQRQTLAIVEAKAPSAQTTRRLLQE